MRRVGTGLATCLTLACLLAGCRADSSADDWLAQVTTAARAAEEAEPGTESVGAYEMLRQAFEAPVPKRVSATDARVVHQDLCFLLGEMDLARGDLERARQWVEQGLALGRHNDVFTANLLVLRGRIHEVTSNDAAAAADYFEALQINEALLREAMGTGPGEETH